MFQDMDVCTYYTYTQLYSYTHIIVDQTLHDMCTIELQCSTFRTPELKKKTHQDNSHEHLKAVL